MTNGFFLDLTSEVRLHKSDLLTLSIKEFRFFTGIPIGKSENLGVAGAKARTLCDSLSENCLRLFL